jgi:isopentenyl diphosphate isomerase/L-lactate dehydrogenase-like FMN-dependent dehydrogenase
VLSDRPQTLRLVRRAEAIGCKALVITVDAPVLGRRERDVRNGFMLRKGLSLANIDRVSGEPRARASGQGTRTLRLPTHDVAIPSRRKGKLRPVSSPLHLTEIAAVVRLAVYPVRPCRVAAPATARAD